MGVLIGLTLLPLIVILLQWSLGADGLIENAPYKLALLVPPLLYCLVKQISLRDHILKLGHWRNGLKAAMGLGVLALAIFWGAYVPLGNLLLNKQAIVAKIQHQFSVNAATVFLIAPVTIVLNSFLEEFFYRGFTFGQLVRKNAAVGYLLPAAAFTLQHIFFFYRWNMGLLPFGIATLGLFVFALVTQKVYAATDTIVAPWLIHVFGDVAMMGVAVEMLYFS